MKNSLVKVQKKSRPKPSSDESGEGLGLWEHQHEAGEGGKWEGERDSAVQVLKSLGGFKKVICR